MFFDFQNLSEDDVLQIRALRIQVFDSGTGKGKFGRDVFGLAF